MIQSSFLFQVTSVIVTTARKLGIILVLFVYFWDASPYHWWTYIKNNYVRNDVYGIQDQQRQLAPQLPLPHFEAPAVDLPDLEVVLVAQLVEALSVPQAQGEGGIEDEILLPLLGQIVRIADQVVPQTTTV